mmetsp:Transcript_51463/g.130870  ORF Transcript_51463/g.130870 Transcript_51463/m.130870 type:complete len:445 (-) Transcript_51463:161-1495(-)
MGRPRILPPPSPAWAAASPLAGRPPLPLLLLVLGSAPVAAQPTAPTSSEAPPKRTRPPPSFPLPPDVRPPGCNAEVADPDGRNFSDLKVSIIIPYRNEKWDHIKGSLESVLYYTPKKLLNEIMFVSDGNGPTNMYIHELRAMSRLVSLLVLPSPGVGLIEAKMRAVAGAAVNSEVLVFLEPHIRVNRQWLQPLLRRIRLYPKVLAMPALDPIPQDDFHKYYAGTPGHWRFEWNLNLVYTNPNEDSVQTSTPYPSPATSGGIFAIRRDWWNELAFYDHGMIGWGGDHIEATLKVWRCGGHIEIVPCSHIGHLFREPSHRPYSVEVNQVVRNYGRIAAVWMEDYMDYFYKVKGEAREMDFGNLTEAFAVKDRLQCKSMSWYLENVDPEMGWEKDHICVPGCSRQEHGDLCCEQAGYPGRSTIDRIMPKEEWRSATRPQFSSSRDEL